MGYGITPGPPCPEESLRQAEALLGMALPESLLRLLAEGDGRFNRHGQWSVAWPLARIVQENLTAWEQRGLPRSLLALGDDGTGIPFCLELQGREDRVVQWSWNDSGVAVVEGSWAEFSREWLDAP